MFLEAIRTHQAALPELRSFATFTAEDLASNPKHLHQIYSIVRIFPRAKRELCRFPLFRSTVGTTPQAHLFSGYAPFVKTNTGFRRLPSLVAQHQLNAHLGLVAPLSRGEINSILKQHIRHYESGIDKKIESDLCLIGLLRYLKRCQHNPMSAVAIAAPQDGFAKVRIELPFRVPLRCLAALRPQDQDTLRIGDPLHVVPAHYSLPENTLLFKRVR